MYIRNRISIQQNHKLQVYLCVISVYLTLGSVGDVRDLVGNWQRWKFAFAFSDFVTQVANVRVFICPHPQLF